MKLWIKNTKVTTKIIGWIQILGGITGLGLIAWLLLKTGEITGPLLLIFIVGLSLFIFSIYSGSVLLTKDKLKLGLILSMINVLLQLVHFRFNGSGLTYSSGFDLSVGYDNGLKLSFEFITSLFQMSINSDEVSLMLKLNLVAVLLLWILADIFDYKFSKKNADKLDDV
jgi:hypothetical protein